MTELHPRRAATAAVLARYDLAGDLVEARSVGGDGTDYVQTVEVVGESLVVSGFIGGPVTFDTGLPSEITLTPSSWVGGVAVFRTIP
jgi:hypothetical protein